MMLVGSVDPMGGIGDWEACGRARNVPPSSSGCAISFHNEC